MWEILGYEENVKDDGSVSYVIHVAKDMKPVDGCSGRKVRSHWYKADKIDYVPQVGQEVIIETEMRGKYEVVTDIWVP